MNDPVSEKNVSLSDAAAVTGPDLAWLSEEKPVAYPDAVETMRRQADAIASGRATELIWLLEHPPLYTAGTSADPKHLLNAEMLPVYPAGRGGGYTYHGPGQRIAYVLLDVRKRFGGDVGRFVDRLEDWIEATIAEFGLKPAPGSGARGVWVNVEDGDASSQRKKIASIGIRLHRGISMHGIAINVAPDLTQFSGIVACGGDGEQQTSLSSLGVNASMDDVDRALRAQVSALTGCNTASRSAGLADVRP